MTCTISSGGGGTAGVGLAPVVEARLTTALLSVQPCPAVGGVNDAQALFDEMTTPPTGARKTGYEDFIAGLKADGLWDDLEIMYVAASEHIDDAKINIKKPTDVLTTSANEGTGASWTSNVGWRCNSASNMQRVGTGLTIGSLPNFDHFNCTFGVVSSGNHNSTNFEIYENAAGTFRLSVGSEAVTVDNIALAESGGARSNNVETQNRCVHAVKRVGGGASLSSSNGLPFVGVGSYTNTNNQTQFGNTLKIAVGFNTFEDARVPLFFYYSIPLSNAQVAALNLRCKTFLEALAVPGFVILAETTALLAAMSVQPTAARKSTINQTIQALKLVNGANNAWDKTDLLYFAAAHDEQASRLNWKNPGSNTLVDLDSFPTSPAMTFVTDRGWQMALARYFSAGINWGSLTKFLRDDAYLAAWADAGAGAVVMKDVSDTVGNSNPRISLNVHNTANATAQLNDQSVIVGQGAGGGFALATRTGANARQLSRNGQSPLTTDAVGSTDAPTPSFPVQFALFQGAGAARKFQMGAVGGGIGLSHGIYYRTVRDYMRAVGVV